MPLDAGLLVGLGTRAGSGCASGHGVCGLANLLSRALAATGVFVSTAIATIFIARHWAGAFVNFREWRPKLAARWTIDESQLHHRPTLSQKHKMLTIPRHKTQHLVVHRFARKRDEKGMRSKAAAAPATVGRERFVVTESH